MSASQLSTLLHSHQAAACDNPSEVPVLFSVHAAEVDPRGVHHAVLRSDQGHFQYVALRQGRVLFMDPPVCEPRLKLKPGEVMHRRLSEVSDLKHELHLGRIESESGEKEELLHAKEDHLVQDCVALFKREFAERCSAALPDVDVLSASLEVVDGFLVRLRASFAGSGEEEKDVEVHHRIWCAFEVGYEPSVVVPNAGDEPSAPVAAVHSAAAAGADPLQSAQGEELAGTIASLKEQLGDKARLLGDSFQLSLPEEKHGLHGKVVMHLDICDSAKPETEEPEMTRLRKLVEGRGLGELSLVKGYRHVYDGIPHWADELQNKEEVNASEMPTDFSLGTAFPMCFLGKEVIRSQGMCGSCWAFASATALMTNICTVGAGNHSLSDTGQRFEVSVQRILSCNVWGMGCQGGHAGAASDAFENVKIAKERNVPYACGGGNSLEHFDTANSDCEANPWGGSDATCGENLAEPNWHFGKLAMAYNHTDMQKVILSGKALYVSFTCYQNVMYGFWEEGDGVYATQDGELLGGHAVVALGFGVSSAGRDYWLLQNSWSDRWGEGGYFKFLRGVNFCGIETGSIYFQGWPTGVAPPELPEVPKTEPGGSSHPGAFGIDLQELREKVILFTFGIGLLCVASWLRCCCADSGKGGSYNRVPAHT